MTPISSKVSPLQYKNTILHVKDIKNITTGNDRDNTTLSVVHQYRVVHTATRK